MTDTGHKSSKAKSGMAIGSGIQYSRAAFRTMVRLDEKTRSEVMRVLKDLPSREERRMLGQTHEGIALSAGRRLVLREDGPQITVLAITGRIAA